MILITLLLGVFYIFQNSAPEQKIKNNTPIEKNEVQKTPTPPPPLFSSPISNAKNRITKKPFGIKISPTTSPVSPEKFFGYHTGVDFEILTNEENSEIPVYVICDGNILLKKSASGYGGVLVQECEIDNEPVTVIYGHLKLSSITAKVGDKLSSGKQIGILGKGFSSETDGERKHLHLSIHKGTSINILGYTQKHEDLNNWLNIADYLN